METQTELNEAGTLRIQLDGFTRYNVRFYLALLVVINKAGGEYVIRIGEFTASAKITELAEAAKKCRIVHLPQIKAHLDIGAAKRAIVIESHQTAIGDFPHDLIDRKR